MIVLLALDDSIYSELAFRSVQQRSWSQDTHFILCSVIEQYVQLSNSPDLVTSDMRKDEDRWKAQTTQMLLKKSDKLRAAHPECTVETKIEFGVASEKILEIACRLGAAEIILGSHGRSGFAHYLLGSVAEQVASCTPCTVEIIKSPRLLVRDPSALPRNLNGLLDQKRILLVLTETADGKLAQKWVLENEWQPDQKIWVMTAGAVKLVKDFVLVGPGKSSSMIGNHVTEYHFAQLAKFETKQVETTGVIKYGNAAEEILNVAEEIEANLIIIGADEPSTYNQSNAGTTASTIASKCSCSVRVVKANS